MNNSRFTSSAPIIGLILLVVFGFGYLLFLVSSGANFVLPGSRQALIAPSGDPLVTKVATPTIPTSPTVTSNDFILGDPNSPVAIFVFSDFSCPFCSQMAAELEHAVSTHPNVHLIWKDFPITTLHPFSLNEHIAARCAGAQGKFWEFNDRLFANQSVASRDDLLGIARTLNLKASEFSACLDSPETLRPIQANIDLGNALGIDGTPYLFVGDQRISGVVSAEELSQIIDLHSKTDVKK